MTWKFGTDLSYARLNVIPFFGASGGRWEYRTLNTDRSRANNINAGGNNLASLMVGVPNAVQVRPLLVNYDYRWKGGALFVQNDWRIRPNITLNLGFRYSLQLPRVEKNDLQGEFRLDRIQTVTLTDAQRRAIASGTGGLVFRRRRQSRALCRRLPAIPAFSMPVREGIRATWFRLTRLILNPALVLPESEAMEIAEDRGSSFAVAMDCRISR